MVSTKITNKKKKKETPPPPDPPPTIIKRKKLDHLKIPTSCLLRCSHHGNIILLHIA